MRMFLPLGLKKGHGEHPGDYVYLVDGEDEKTRIRVVTVRPFWSFSRVGGVSEDVAYSLAELENPKYFVEVKL